MRRGLPLGSRAISRQTWFIHLLGRLLRLGRIGSQINFLDVDEVAIAAGAAELDGILSRHLEIAVECVGGVAPDGEGRRRSGEAGRQTGDGGGETHRSDYRESRSRMEGRRVKKTERTRCGCSITRHRCDSRLR